MRIHISSCCASSAHRRSGAILSSELKKIYRVNVSRWNHVKHKSFKNGKHSLRIDYHLEMGAPIQQISSYVCLPPDYEGQFVKNWMRWWAVNTWDPTQAVPQTVDEAYLRCGELKRPKVIDIRRRDEKYWDIIKVIEYAEEEEDSLEDEDATGLNF